MKRRSDEEISAPLYAFDAEVRSQYGCFAGVDEAGRGPLAGGVYAAAVILDPARPVEGLADSKKLSAARREAQVTPRPRRIASRIASPLPSSRTTLWWPRWGSSNDSEVVTDFFKFKCLSDLFCKDQIICGKVYAE